MTNRLTAECTSCVSDIIDPTAAESSIENQAQKHIWSLSGPCIKLHVAHRSIFFARSTYLSIGRLDACQGIIGALKYPNMNSRTPKKIRSQIETQGHDQNNSGFTPRLQTVSTYRLNSLRCCVSTCASLSHATLTNQWRLRPIAWSHVLSCLQSAPQTHPQRLPWPHSPASSSAP